MALLRCALMAALALLGLGGIARADHEPAIVIPGKPGVPVIVNGRDVSGGILIGDWGLYRPGHVTPVFIPLRTYRLPPPRRVRRYPIAPTRAVRRHVVHRHAVCRCAVHRPPARRAAVRRAAPRPAVVSNAHLHYFPGGELDRVIKTEPYIPPQPAESYSREWSTKPLPFPADINPSAPIIVEPVVRRPPRKP